MKTRSRKLGGAGSIVFAALATEDHPLKVFKKIRSLGHIDPRVLESGVSQHSRT
jgi:hypothetical protein